MIHVFAFYGSTSLHLPRTQNARTNGIITVKGSFELSDICDKEFHKMAQTFSMTAKYGQLKGKTEKETTTTMRQSEENKAGSIEPEVKKLRVQMGDPNKSVTNESGTPAT
jgi:hypothetical protein